MPANIREINQKSRIIRISLTLLKTPLQIAEILWVKSVSCDFELVDLATHPLFSFKREQY